MRERNAMRVISNLPDLVGLASLIGFTSIVILISLISQGAIIYYYEPNKFIWIAEVFLGTYGIIIGIRRIKGCLLVEEVPKRELNKSAIE
ncbi:MAG: hypothetical protein WBC40_04365 [Halobacteriota archaeon]